VRTARAYLFRAVRNRALNYLRDRKARRAAPLHAARDVPRQDADPGADLRYGELVAAYHAAVDALPERRRLAFRLSRLYGLTYEEIADVMDVSVNTVRTQMAAALAHLRDRLAPFLQ
jgi:RNA polymerase sigma-70 factor (ECF subfamily)